MKAKRYYLNEAESTAHADRLSSRWSPVFVLPASALSKTIEGAAKAIAARYGDKDWSKTSQRWRDEYLADARAAYKAGGFES